MWLLAFLWSISLLFASALSATPDYDVSCSPKTMKVSMNVNKTNTLVYLENLRDYPGCQPEISDGKAIFKLPLDNIYLCGMFKMENRMTGQRIFYHRIIIEVPNESKDVVLVTCTIPGHKSRLKDNRTRRDTLPENFSEPEFVNITQYIEAKAPVPYLNLAVRQNGRVVDTALNVHPGTPLEMVIFLDDKSAPTYGLLTSYMKITDSTPAHEEIIIMNGCSIDPYIFGNFETSDGGDTLSAKFRAFKFPESNYVLFVGTVNICLQQCKGVPCGNGQFGYGRRKREIPPEMPYDANKIFEVEMTAFIKVQYDKPQKDAVANGLDNKMEATESFANGVEESKMAATESASNLLSVTENITQDKGSSTTYCVSLVLASAFLTLKKYF